MKILNVFNHYLERGGEEIVIEEICSVISRKLELRQLSFYSKDWKSESLFLKILQPFRMFYHRKAVREFRAMVRDFSPDLILFHNAFPVGSLGLYRAALRTGIPVVQYIHNFRPFSVSGYCWANSKVVSDGFTLDFKKEVEAGAWQGSRLKTYLYSKVLLLGHRMGIWQSISGWIAISDFVREKFVEGGIKPDRCVTVRHPWFGPIPEEEQPESDQKAGDQFLFMGRLTEEKGILTLLEAWKKLESRTDFGTLVIAGTGPLEAEVKAKADELERVSFRGFVSGAEKEGLLGESIGMVIPSLWWEPLGLVAYEAYSRRMPVFAANSGGLAEVVVDGETGWVHEPGDAEALSKHLELALEKREERTRRGKGGLDWLSRHSSQSEWEGLLLEHLRNFAGGGKA